jgi:hypothetical protein
MDNGKRQFLIKDYDTITLLTFMAGSINETVKHAHYANRKITKNVAEEMFRMCWDGIKA